MNTNKKDVSSKAGHRDRLRDKFLKSGLDAFHDYEVLEFLIMHAIPRQDVKPTAKNLIADFGSLINVLNAKYEDLIAIKGVTRNVAVLILFIRALCTKYLEYEICDKPIKLTTAPQVVNFARMKIASAQHETLMSIFMNSSNQVLAFEFSNGTVDHAAVYVRELVRKALDVNATAIILIHNHPFGNCTPSADDIDVTRSLRKSLFPIGIRLLDHIVITPREYFSMEASGLFKTDQTGQ